LEAVAVDYISWLGLIQQKHRALQALRCGDPEPWRKYLCERECVFWNPEDRPLVGQIVVRPGVMKNRGGLAEPKLRIFALDRQQGSLAHGELPHWWMVIRDVVDYGEQPREDGRKPGDSMLVWEGKCVTDEDVIDVLDQHECIRCLGVADSGDDTMFVYQFCLRYGINAIKGGKEMFYSHGDKGRKIFSVEKPLHQMTQCPPTRQDPVEEPQFWFYSKYGIRDRLQYLRGGGYFAWEVPEDVSDDYKKHNEAEVFREVKRGGQIVHEYDQIKRRNDLYVCECYIAMLMEKYQLIGTIEETK
jgi:hypothetical protein